MNAESMPQSHSDKDAMRFDNLHDWLEWQEELHFTAIELGLDRCTAVAENMGLLDPDFTVISVAGTNGKGSSVVMMESILANSGYKTGCYTSPHLIRYNERVKLNGVEVSDEKLCESFSRIDQARGDISLTYFEFGTLAALDIFHHENIDVALLEVGLGGRLDAVNCLDADAALVSSIDLDHMQWLGMDRETIAREKAGIFRSDKPAICSDPHPPETILEYAEEIGATLYIPGRDFNYQLSDDRWSWQWGSLVYESLPRPGQYNSCQVQNAAGVLMVLNTLKSELPLKAGAIEKGLENFSLTGRFQMLTEGTQTILDVAHNTQAARTLVHNLKQFPSSGKTHIIIGMLKDKDQTGFLSVLTEIADSWHAVSTTSSRGCDSVTLKNELLGLGVTVPISESDTVANAFLKLQKETGMHDRIVVTGSFLSVGDAIKYLEI
ncbi:MAG: bifunctional tetrahydrofolate synthase/dihydrofolate synthase [Gammaproteobacteria bacterium]|nr:MAG: bifunctional tetrahydrofolate synthase/dihydrofolate synthase [Gammaproteobacteria bacterium]